MKRIVIIILIIAGIVDFISYQDIFDRNKQFISYQEDGKTKLKRYKLEGLQLHIKKECRFYRFYNINLLKKRSNEFIKPIFLSDANGASSQSYDNLEEGFYKLDIVDNEYVVSYKY
jgi:hypothetical protein